MKFKGVLGCSFLLLVVKMQSLGGLKCGRTHKTSKNMFLGLVCGELHGALRIEIPEKNNTAPVLT